MTATATRFPEAFADPRMQAIFEEELAWGLPYASFDAFMTHSVQGVGELKDTLEIEGGDDPFAWGDDEMHNTASAALLILRNKQHLTNIDFTQLCWLEKSLFEEVCYCIAGSNAATEKRNLSRFTHLISAEQLQVARDFDKRLDEDDGDFIDEMFPSDQPLALEDKGGNIVRLPSESDEAVERTAAMLEEVFGLFSDEYKEASRQKRIRVLEYLTNIS